MTNLSARLANMSDIEEVFEVFVRAIEVMNQNQIPQWDEVYPTKEDLKADIENNELYIVESDNMIMSVFVLNQDYDEEYEEGEWKYTDASFCVIHRLCVNPSFQNKGIGRKTMQLVEELVKEKGIETIRLDAFSQNPFALKMYEKLNYCKVGEVSWRKGLFYLMEKKL
ncbi:putative acetyltransferase [compost metagenome]